jgi:hypothetical protein
MLMFGLVPLVNCLNNPRLAGLRGADFMQILGGGLCIGVSVGILIGARGFPGR